MANARERADWPSDLSSGPGETTTAAVESSYIQIIDREQIDPGSVASTPEVARGVLVDLDASGRVLGVERIGGAVGMDTLAAVLRAVPFAVPSVAGGNTTSDDVPDLIDLGVEPAVLVDALRGTLNSVRASLARTAEELAEVTRQRDEAQAEVKVRGHEIDLLRDEIKVRDEIEADDLAAFRAQLEAQRARRNPKEAGDER